VIYLQDGELARRDAGRRHLTHHGGAQGRPTPSRARGDYGVASKEEFPHYMLKEIHEQPRVHAPLPARPVQVDEGNAKLGGLEMSPRDLRRASAGRHPGLRHELPRGHGRRDGDRGPRPGARPRRDRQRVPAPQPRSSSLEALYFAVSQSGETADTLGAVQEVQLKGGEVMGVVNVVGSTIARTCGQGRVHPLRPRGRRRVHQGLHLQVTALLVFTLMLARTRDLSLTQGQRLAGRSMARPRARRAYLAGPGPDRGGRARSSRARYALFLGRGVSYPVALEGALKLKEIAYIPARPTPRAR
jgi:glucosamine--fructose-6-phosphate aminotransferase (isomerizing)